MMHAQLPVYCSSWGIDLLIQDATLEFIVLRRKAAHILVNTLLEKKVANSLNYLMVCCIRTGLKRR